MISFILVFAMLGPGDDTGTPEKTVPDGKPKTNAEIRKEARDRVLRAFGNEALAFTKAYGDLGIAALQACHGEPETGKNLVRLYNAGEMSKLKNPRAVLEVVRRCGHQAGAWIVEHHQQLVDPEALDAFTREPMDFVFDLKDLDVAAAQLRESRKYSPQTGIKPGGEWNTPVLVIGALVLALVAYFLWKRRPTAP
jgi:hypothetical protein